MLDQNGRLIHPWDPSEDAVWDLNPRYIGKPDDIFDPETFKVITPISEESKFTWFDCGYDDAGQEASFHERIRRSMARIKEWLLHLGRKQNV